MKYFKTHRDFRCHATVNIPASLHSTFLPNQRPTVLKQYPKSILSILSSRCPWNRLGTSYPLGVCLCPHFFVSVQSQPVDGNQFNNQPLFSKPINNNAMVFLYTPLNPCKLYPLSMFLYMKFHFFELNSLFVLTLQLYLIQRWGELVRLQCTCTPLVHTFYGHFHPINVLLFVLPLYLRCEFVLCNPCMMFSPHPSTAVLLVPA